MTRTVIFTGASSGIGKATAVVLAHRGYDLGLTWTRRRAGGRRRLAGSEVVSGVRGGEPLVAAPLEAQGPPPRPGVVVPGRRDDLERGAAMVEG